MAISAQDVKQLKDMTGSGLMDCKKALQESNGDFDEAVKYLREKGLAKAAKKAGRVAAEGLVYAKVDNAKQVGVVLEINSETDFAAKSEKFKAFVDMIADTLIDNDVSDVEALKEMVPAGHNEKIADILVEHISTIGENIQIRRFKRLTGNIYSYIHDGGGSIIATIVKLSSDAPESDEVKLCAKNLLLQITAMTPQFISHDCIDPAVYANEKEIQTALVAKENEAKPKPQNVLDKIIEGRMRKFAEEICLMEQVYVKDQATTVEKYVASVGHDIKVLDFASFEKGEGVEKKEDNFADEVASMIK